MNCFTATILLFLVGCSWLKPEAKCGDGRVSGNEECDPSNERYNAFNCSPSCKQITFFTPCGPGLSECRDGSVCNLGLCSRKCEDSNECKASTGAPQVDAYCPIPKGNTCVVACKTNADCPPGASCNGAAVCEAS